MARFLTSFRALTWLVLAAVLTLAAPVQAQQTVAEIAEETQGDDQGFITRLLQEKLSGAGRQVHISGFQGALSSRATFRELTISDDDGTWITLQNGAIQWTRSALFLRRVEIQELSAETVILPRLPGGGDASAQSAEIPEFSLPVLPVGINIDKIAIGRLELGEPVIGLAAVASVSGSMKLAGGEGQADLTINRLDGPRGVFDLGASFSNETRVLDLNLDLDEDADGIFANLVGIEGRPAVKAEIKGQGPLSQFAADLRMATDGQDRVTGRVALNAAEQDGQPGTSFRVEMSGDIAALVPAEHKDFFGASSQLLAEGWRGQSGKLNIPALMVDTDALNLSGSVTTTDKGAPQSAVLLLNLGEDADASTVPVRLPWADKPTTVRSGSLQLSYDAAQDSVWTLRGRVGDVARAEGTLTELKIGGRGHVEMTDGGLDLLRGWIAFGLTGMAPTDPALAQATGDNMNGGLNFHFRPGNALNLFGMNINGADFRLTGDTTVSGLSSGLALSGDLTMSHRDLARFSGLAGRDLSGQAEARFDGRYVLLSKAFDVDATINGTDITVDQDHADRLLAGKSTIELSARRDETGINLRKLNVNAQNLTAEAAGYLNSDGSDVKAVIAMPDLSVADPAMSGSVTARAQVSGPDGARRLVVDGDAVDLVTGIAELDGALAGESRLSAELIQNGDSYELSGLKLDNPQLTIDGQGSFAQGALDATVDFDMADLAVLQRGFSGGLKAQARASEKDGVRSISVTGTGTDLRLGQESTDGALTGETRLSLLAEEQGGNVTVKEFNLANDQMRAQASGVVGSDRTDLRGDVSIRSLASFGKGWRGAVDAQGSFADDGQGGRRLDVTGTGRDLSFGQAQVDGALAGETRLRLSGTERGGVFEIDSATVANPRLNLDATGKVGGGQTDLTARMNAADLRFLGRGFRGAVDATAQVTEADGARNVTLNGTADGLAVGVAQADTVLAGRTTIDAAVSLDAQNRLTIQRVNAGNGNFRVNADGNPELINLDARLNDLGSVVPGFPGPLQVRGTIGQQPQNFQMDLDVTAPGNLRSTIEGTVARDFATANLGIRGNADAAVANPFLRTRSVEGPVTFDLRVNGRPSIEALTGQLRLSNARLAEPRLGLSVESLNASADFAGGRVQVDVQGQLESGGTLSVSGPIALTGDRAMNLTGNLRRVVLRDPDLYEVLVDGQVSVTGSAAQGPLVAGRIDVREAELRIPSTGFGGAASIPEIKHLYDRPPVRATRAKAGLSEFPSQDSRFAGMNSPPATPPANPARFDLTISAPRQVFVRGRGVDAELGGEIHVGGNARQPIPVGQLELIRGRVDLLGKRFDLTEGLIEMQGSLIPVIRLVAQTSQDGITTRIIIDGEAQDPEIHFESDPGMPEEEVLSHLLFGRGLDTISPLQAAQLANAIAVLAGRGGEGIVGRLRSATGLDDLDLATDDEGNVSVRAGKYLSKNLYTDVQVGGDGTTRLNLNLDISDTLTARGSVASDGKSTIGIYYERDY
ncbi:translocation/assembly module TamB domain-containing protein [Paracoccus sp. DMF-8]|uniref:translocation/assembly module TamB domain-containing protein n=1 Tax=Paracoccus sp. DMF-8 TaxID=3019445 RepID=UPI0023E3BF35|nr:translocation/assembly module TamB domain-containing protein [Paracoccus sp. DMF-8]MDF3607305.1 translocation/assembly module TamB domain-containing protein [Paracoccus sp. DMF-8]